MENTDLKFSKCDKKELTKQLFKPLFGVQNFVCVLH